jgi:homoserine dehydrogenase
VKVGLLGCGTVGAATARILVERAADLEARAGQPIELSGVAVRTLKERDLPIAPELWTDDPWALVNDPDIDVVVELIGGPEPALPLMLAAMKSGKHVVTANKEVVAAEAEALFEAATEAGVDLLFEAAVGGGIPIVRPMKESLSGDRVRRLMGIMNGTTNFILTRMSETGDAFEDALAEATRLGYAEQDPTADVEGFDAASKLAILASIAFDSVVSPDDVQREGIRKVRAADITAAHALGYEIKLVAVAEIREGAVSARVHPALVPREHPLASVRDVYNAVFIEAEQAGELMFMGRGAGGQPTASAVVADIVEVARNMRSGATALGYWGGIHKARMLAPDDVPTRFYVVLSVSDQPGVLASVAGVFATHGVSISSVRQEGASDKATLTLVTHTASEGSHRRTFEELEGLDAVRAVDSTIRLEGAPE